MSPNRADCPPALRTLLQRLEREARIEIAQHDYTPHPDEWFGGTIAIDPDGTRWGGGDVGPCESAETAIVKTVAWLHRLYEETRQQRDEAEAEVLRLRQLLDGGDEGLEPWRRALEG